MMNRHRKWSPVSVIAPVGGNTFVPRELIILSESFVSWVSSISDAPSSAAASGDSTKTSSPTTLRVAGRT